MKKIRILLTCLFWLGITIIPLGDGLFAQENKIKNVLILNSYHQGFQWNDNLVKGIKAVLKPTDNINLHIESMDTKRIYTPEHLKNLLNLYQHKFRNIEFDLIITSDNNAFNFIRKHRNLLFPQAPVVFFGVNDFKDEDIKGLDWITGMAETMDIKGTIDTALKLHPKANTIYVINDYTPTGIAMKKSIIELLKNWKDPPRIVFSKDASMDDLLIDIEQLPQNTLIYLGAFFRDKTGQYFFPEETTQLIVEYSPVPVYTSIEILFRNGVVGGNLIEGYVEGGKAASIGKQIIDGTSPDRIPVVKTDEVRSIFDYDALTKWKVNAKQLPPDSVILNQPSSFYEEYKTLVWQVASVIVVLLAFILVLLMNIHKRKQAEGALKESEEKFRILYNNSPDMYVLVSPDDSSILLCNDTLLNKTNYSREDIIGYPIFKMYHEDCVAEAKKVFQQFVETDVINDKELVLAKKDGSKIDVTLNTNAVKDETGEIQYSISSWRDITAHKRALEALRESEERYRSLVENQTDLVSRFTPDGTFVFVNDAYCHFVEKTKDELIGKKWHPLPVDDDLSLVQEKLQTLSPSNPTVLVENRILSGKGNIHWMQFVNSGLFDLDGHLIEIQSVGRDITERKQNEAELEKYQKHLETLVKERTAELEEKNAELERMNEVFVGREFRIKKLRDRVKELELAIDD